MSVSKIKVLTLIKNSQSQMKLQLNYPQNQRLVKWTDLIKCWKERDSEMSIRVPVSSNEKRCKLSISMIT
jgi:hypothetical protein